jgi:seryl-tRNA synthetase
MGSGSDDEDKSETPDPDAKKAEVASLKGTQTDLEGRRDAVDAAMHELLAGLPNIPADDVPTGRDESANKEVR